MRTGPKPKKQPSTPEERVLGPIRRTHLGILLFVVAIIVATQWMADANRSRRIAATGLAKEARQLAWQEEHVLRLAVQRAGGDTLRDAFAKWQSAAHEVRTKVEADASLQRWLLRFDQIDQSRALTTKLLAERTRVHPRNAVVKDAAVLATQEAERYSSEIDRFADDVDRSASENDALLARLQILGLCAVVALLLVESPLLARRVSVPLRRSLFLERQTAAQEQERRTIEARARELRIQNEELERLAATDALTGLPNRRAFIAWLRRESWRLSASGIPLGVLMIDLDHFKTVNDVYGHAAGDEALQRVGNAILGCIRSTDLAARYGGEEFVVLLPGSSELDTAETAESIREAIAHLGESEMALRVSIGAVSGIPDFDGDSLVRSADRALYEAKRTGRDKTVLARPKSRPVANPSN